ncbi:Poly(glycerol-phosphate) alpha-glucosyltransferase [Rhodovulum sp. PH10]|uniref:glycosyltransferase n=1 Tax=Rhodovulum sp. PH10 TaxID=1187851 RepID=UPI00027C203C|nr:glycosyltransferase [Rhodovulum sp. PH10]EJW11498.1 Poly(glycerol-phosphate) alpha-glucosyltransferase [Rhodovulum sp. PH10]
MCEAALKILSIAHPAVSRAAGRLRYRPFAARRDLDVHLVVPTRWHQFGRTMVADPPGDPGVTTHVMPILFPRGGPMKWYLHVYPRLRRKIRDVAPDVIHLWEEPWSFVALQACLLKNDAALVLEVDQNILKRLPPPFEAIRRFVLRRTDHILSRSPDATAVVRACGYAGPVTPIGYGVDQDTFRPTAAPRAHEREPGPLTLGYVGRVVVEKGLDDALDAMAKARTRARLVIMGEGPHLPALQARAAALGLSDRVSFERWGTPNDVAAFIQTLDALVLLTRTTEHVKEQFGRVITEAQACGVPVIGSTCGAIPDVIGDGGWAVPESDPAALAKLIDQIAADPAARLARAERARANVASRFTYAATAQALAAAWTQAAAAQPKRRDKLQKIEGTAESDDRGSRLGKTSAASS